MVDSQVDIFRKSVKWEQITPIPVCHNGHTTVLLGGCIYIGGGSFSITAQYHNFAMTILDNKLIIVGGVSKNDEVAKKILFLNAGQWKITVKCQLLDFVPLPLGIILC